MAKLWRKSASFDNERDIFISRVYRHGVSLKPNNYNRSIELGFSILEMLLVLAIISILSTLAIPRFQAISAQSDVDIVAREMAQQMEFAKTHAQTNNVTVTACPVTLTSLNTVNPTCLNTNNWQAWIWYVGERSENQILMRSSLVPPSVSFTSNGQNALITFNAIGNALGSNQTFMATSTNGSSNVGVVLAQTGRVRIETIPILTDVQSVGTSTNGAVGNANSPAN